MAAKLFLQTFNASGIMLPFEKSQRDLRFVELETSRCFDSVGVEHYVLSFSLTAMSADATLSRACSTPAAFAHSKDGLTLAVSLV